MHVYVVSIGLESSFIVMRFGGGTEEYRHMQNKEVSYTHIEVEGGRERNREEQRGTERNREEQRGRESVGGVWGVEGESG